MTKNLQRISDKIIFFHREKYMESLSPMKLQKLCYYAQGFYIANSNGDILFEEDFEAWQHGPVIRELYNEYKDLKWKPINKDINNITTKNEEDPFLIDIVSSFGSYEGATLSLMTHREDPWIDARKNLPELSPSTEIITKKSLYSYFLKNND